MWKILETAPASAEENMRVDADLLETLGSFPVLHFYAWQRKSATYGCLVKPEEFLKMDQIKEKQVDLARRPTGGGIVFHIWDFAFSVLIPRESSLFIDNTLKSYHFINQIVMEAVEEYGALKGSLHMIKEDKALLDRNCTRFCMARPTKYDVVQGNKKIVGAAQRKTKKGMLHQGTVSLQRPDLAFLSSLLLPDTQVIEGMKEHTAALLGEQEDLEEGRGRFKEMLAKTFTRKR